MARVVLVDAGPLGEISNPRNQDAHDWLARLVGRGDRVVVPEIADYEVRRELIRSNKVDGLARLDKLAVVPGGYVALSTTMMRLAAEMWAQIRNRGEPTAPDHALDADVILAAQAEVVGREGGWQVVVATTNTSHLGRLTTAVRWDQLP